jgi:hypothetical protein
MDFSVGEGVGIFVGFSGGVERSGCGAGGYFLFDGEEGVVGGFWLVLV